MEIKRLINRTSLFVSFFINFYHSKPLIPSVAVFGASKYTKLIKYLQLYLNHRKGGPLC